MSLLEVILMCVVLCGTGKVGIGWLLKKDTAKEDRRRGAAKMAAKLSQLGLVKTPEFLIDYSVGDYSSMAAKLKDVAQTFLAGDAEVIAEFGGIFERVLKAKLATKDGRALIDGKLQEAIAQARAVLPEAAILN